MDAHRTAPDNLPMRPKWYIPAKVGARQRAARRIFALADTSVPAGEMNFRYLRYPPDDPTRQHKDLRLHLIRQLEPLWKPEGVEGPEVIPILVAWLGVLFANPILLKNSDPLSLSSDVGLFDHRYPSWALKEAAQLLIKAVQETQSNQYDRLHRWFCNSHCPLSGEKLTPTNATGLSIATAIILTYLNPKKPFNPLRTIRLIKGLLSDWGGELPPGDCHEWVELWYTSGHPPRATQSNIRQHQSNQEELLEYLELLPLGGDLHVHLVGTGSAKFWADFANESRIQKPHGRFFVPFIEDDFGLTGQGGAWARFFRSFQNRDRLKKRPEFLKKLISWNVEQAKAEGIFYLEYSVGLFLFRLQKTLVGCEGSRIPSGAS